MRVSPRALSTLASLIGRPMTCAELARQMGIHRSAAHRHLRRLRARGLVERRRTHRKWIYYHATAKGHVAVTGSAPAE